MTPFDILLLIIGLFLVIFLTVQRMLRALLILVVTWLATFISAILYRRASYMAQAVFDKNPAMSEGVIFILLFILFMVIGYVVMHSAFPVTKLPKLGVMDYIMGLLLGGVVAVLVLTVLHNGLILMVRVPWVDNEANFAVFAPMIRESGLGEFCRSIMSAYNVTFKLFFKDLPPVLLPL